MLYEDGSKYEGEWEQNQQAGKGYLINSDGKGKETYSKKV